MSGAGDHDVEMDSLPPADPAQPEPEPQPAPADEEQEEEPAGPPAQAEPPAQVDTPLTQAVDTLSKQLGKKRKPALVDEAVELGIYTRLANGEVQEEGRKLKRSKGEVAEAVAKFRIRNRQQGPGSDTVPQTQGRQPLPSTVERRAASARIAEKGAAANIPEQAKVKAYDLAAPLIDVIDEFDTCSQVELGKAPAGFINRASLLRMFEEGQMVPACQTCSRLWNPGSQALDVRGHFTGGKHLDKVAKAAAQDEAAQKTIPGLASRHTSCFELKATKAALYAGITPAALHTALEVLNGITIPRYVPRLGPVVTRNSPKVMEESRAAITDRLKGRRWSVLHDCGSLLGTQLISMVCSARSFSAVLVVPLTDAPVATVLKEEWEKLGLSAPMMVRSDRGGRNGAASREVDAELGIPWVSCIPHIANNAADSADKWLKKQKLEFLARVELGDFTDPASGVLSYVLVSLLDALFSGEDCKNRARRYVEAQQKVLEPAGADVLAELVERMSGMAAVAKPREKEALFAVYRSEVPPGLAALTEAADFDGLLAAARGKLAELQEKIPESAPPCVRCPLLSDTRYEASLKCYLHCRDRLAALHSFAALELKNTQKPCSSLNVLRSLLDRYSTATLHADLKMMCDNTAPLLRVFRKYSDPSAEPHAHQVWGDIEDCIHDLDEAGGIARGEAEEAYLQRVNTHPDLSESASPVAVLLSESLKRLWWGNKGESGYWFWRGVRHLCPQQALLMQTCKTLLPFEQLQLALPQFSAVVTVEAWSTYLAGLGKFAKGKPTGKDKASAVGFWEKYTSAGEGLRCLSLDLLAVPAATTGCDSVFSVGKDALPANRSAAKPDVMASIVFHHCNQDLAVRYPQSHLRHSFPKVRNNGGCQEVDLS